jgi:glutathione S-transferase
MSMPMQKVVATISGRRAQRDPHGVEEAKTQLARVYDHAGRTLADEALGGGRRTFSLADCGAAPALFYAFMVQPFAGRPRVEAYYARLRVRPSFARAVDEARPYRHFFPLPWPADHD